jgi:F5/8 type C domain/Trehalase
LKISRFMRNAARALGITALFWAASAPGSAPPQTDVLPAAAIIDQQTYLVNHDTTWYEKNIPFFDSPDRDINETYYYRWELLTRHLVYGSPESGYTFTEFMDRPGWSGRYGAISCAAGHHLYEARWLRDPRIAEDYARYWVKTQGAQPRNYSAWIADGVWALYKVHGDKSFVTSLKDGLIENYKGWEREHYDKSVGMFWQTGMADGMETNINSRQTVDWFAGAQGYRPTLNAYMFADARAIAGISRLTGDAATATEYTAKSAELKQKVQGMLWDKRRGFFMHMFRHDEKDGIKALTHTYDTGKYAGNEHGREEIGYVPWEFDLPDPNGEYESAWKYLMDPEYFYSPYGPTVTERHDPLFLISKNCCVWSGQSWPYATTQTLEAMGNLLHDYRQKVVTPADYFKLLKTYTLTHRKNGRPYIAESANPDTGSWEGSDNFNHSEHYFHSGYIDLIITGLMGLRPTDANQVDVDPIFPETWDYCAIDRVPYHGHLISIIWDKNGSHYHRGAGLTIQADGKTVAHSKTLRRLSAPISSAVPAASPAPAINFAVNNEGSFYPRTAASFTAPKTELTKIIDGNTIYDVSPPNRWTSEGSHNSSDWCSVTFGIERPVDTVKLYLLDDGPTSHVRAPRSIALEYKSEGAKEWKPVPGVKASLPTPQGGRCNEFRFPPIGASALRAVFVNQPGCGSGLTEFEALGNAPLPLKQPVAKPGNLALNTTGKGYPEASASYTSPFDKVQEVNDGVSQFSTNSRNRWTAYQSPNKTDWVQIDFGAPRLVDMLLLHIWADGGGVQAPVSYDVQYWDGTDWKSCQNQQKMPAEPTPSTVNTVTITPIRTSRVRVVFVHRGKSFSGLTELEIWGEGHHPDD